MARQRDNKCSKPGSKTNTASICRYRLGLWLGLAMLAQQDTAASGSGVSGFANHFGLFSGGRDRCQTPCASQPDFANASRPRSFAPWLSRSASTASSDNGILREFFQSWAAVLTNRLTTCADDVS